MKRDTHLPADLFLSHSKETQERVRRAVRQAVLMHKRIGNPIATWKDGKVIIVQPEDIIVEEPK